MRFAKHNAAQSKGNSKDTIITKSTLHCQSQCCQSCIPDIEGVQANLIMAKKVTISKKSTIFVLS